VLTVSDALALDTLHAVNAGSSVDLARTIIFLVRCIFSREIVVHTARFGSDTRFWPTLVNCRVPRQSCTNACISLKRHDVLYIHTYFSVSSSASKMAEEDVEVSDCRSLLFNQLN
jgi:hypothetical protein